MKKIAVIGSINIDYFVECSTLPKFGETVFGDNFFMNFGGKGANQAVAASRLGGDVTLFGSIGNDEQKQVLLNHFKAENVNIEHLNIVDGVSTGAAFIQLYKGDNRIIITPGANQYTNGLYTKQVKDQLMNYDIFLFQLETPISMLEYLIPLLHKEGKTIILDPAPAVKLPEDVLSKISYLTPNEYEVQEVISHSSNEEQIMAEYPQKLIMTCGKNGVKYHNGERVIRLSARMAEAVDTTGAGDTFTGAFAVALAEGKPFEECLRYGIFAGSLAVTKKGAQSGMPYKYEMEELLQEG
ncbi:ribokinase [Jeotgalibacillus terrae]|uniref:Ribokinase n=1 Tax=Jeotgalibacillus terrae TaxID=587735 RepID=A0ABW5ZFW3_9BACL|nr:ribokinase [Jeotgalibacillus terrae]MBM7577858.1 ribokinase [Jeotgalibacillus terrae]